MRTYPNPRWEFLVGIFDFKRNEKMRLFYPSETPEVYDRLVATSDAYLSLISKLQVHPYLGNLVPAVSLFYLTWHPTEDRAIEVYFDLTKSAYIISVFSRNNNESKLINKEEVSAIDAVVDKIYALITQLRDD